MQTDLININDYCRICHIEPSFIYQLEQDGLIEIRTINGVKYFLSSQLYDIERYTRLYYDLSINIEGIDAILHLLQRINNMQQEIKELKIKLKLYEPDIQDFI